MEVNLRVESSLEGMIDGRGGAKDVKADDANCEPQSFQVSTIARIITPSTLFTPFQWL